MGVDDGEADMLWTADAKEARDMVHLWVKALDGQVRIALTADQADELAERLKQGGRMVRHYLSKQEDTSLRTCRRCGRSGLRQGVIVWADGLCADCGSNCKPESVATAAFEHDPGRFMICAKGACDHQGVAL
jgi:hypothetical protein